jgi:hypothetical protein
MMIMMIRLKRCDDTAEDNAKRKPAVPPHHG